MRIFDRIRSAIVPAVLCLVAVGCGEDPATPGALEGPFAYVPNAGDGTMSVIDMPTLVVAQTVTVSTGEGASTSHGVAVSADGSRLFVGDSLAGLLKVFDTATFELVSELDLGIQVHGIDISPDATRVIASGSRLPDKDHKFTYVVDADAGEVLAEIDTNISGHGDSTPDGRYIYINDIIGHRVAVIDLSASALVNEIIVGPPTWPLDAVGPNEVAFAPDGNTAYSADYGAQTVSILDTSDPTAPLVVGEIPVSDLPHGIDVTADGSELWVSNRASMDVVVIDAATRLEHTRVSTAPYTANHISLTEDDTQAWVTLTATETMSDQTGYILVLDVASRSELARIAVGQTPHEISFED